VDAVQQQTISAPTFETALRAKAKEIIDTMGALEAQASPITFEVQNIPVELAWANNDARVTVVDGAYQLRIPVAWLTAP
jgi:fumarate hydratase class II